MERHRCVRVSNRVSVFKTAYVTAVTSSTRVFLKKLLHLFTLCVFCAGMCACACVFMCQGTLVKAREQLARAGSLYHVGSRNQIQVVKLDNQSRYLLNLSLAQDGFSPQLNCCLYQGPVTTTLHWQQLAFTASSLVNAASHLDSPFPHSERVPTDHGIRHSQTLSEKWSRLQSDFTDEELEVSALCSQVLAKGLKPGIWNLASVLSRGLQNTNENGNIPTFFILQLRTLI